MYLTRISRIQQDVLAATKLIENGVTRLAPPPPPTHTHTAPREGSSREECSPSFLQANKPWNWGQRKCLCHWTITKFQIAGKVEEMVDYERILGPLAMSLPILISTVL
jgi:hypothetical protein